MGIIRDRAVLAAKEIMSYPANSKAIIASLKEPLNAAVIKGTIKQLKGERPTAKQLEAIKFALQIEEQNPTML